MFMQFYAVFLEDSPSDQERVQKAFDKVLVSFYDFLRTEFSYRDGEKPSRDSLSTPEIGLELKVVDSVSSLKTTLLNVDGKLSEIGRSCLFLVLDYFVPNHQGEGAIRITECVIDGISFSKWLRTYFPAIPKVVLTQEHSPDVENEIKALGGFMNKNVLRNEDNFAKKMMQLFKKWWEPEFSKALFAYSSNRDDSWHTPGHNAGSAFKCSELQKGFYSEYGKISFQTDLSVSVDELGDLSEPDLDSPLSRSQRKSAEIFGAKESVYVTNGTSTSNKALLMTLLRPGETVLLDRNCHKSVHQAVVMSGAIPIYLTPDFDEKLGIWRPLPLVQLRSCILADYKPASIKPRMLILTTCTYEGVLYPIDIIADMCQRSGIVFCADEAWAPYLRFHPHYVNGRRRSRYNAMDGGAHFAVQSTHKALAAFSQASMIHVSGEFEKLFIEIGNQWKWLQQRFSIDGKGSYARFRHDFFEILRYWHSTSPHYPMIASLDRAGIQMRFEGAQLIEDRLSWVNALQHKTVDKCCPGALLGLESLLGVSRIDSSDDFSDYMKDPLKIVLRAKNASSLKEFKEIVKRKRLRWEKSSRETIEFLVTIGTQEDDILTNLTEAIELGREHLGPGVDEVPISPNSELAEGQVVVSPRYATLCDGEMVEISKARGRVCGQMLTPYPPGIPIYLPGLEINETMVRTILEVLGQGDAHDNVHGLFEDNGHFVKVLSAAEEKRYHEMHRDESETIGNIRRFSSGSTQ